MMEKYRKKPIVIEAIRIEDAWFDRDHPNPMHPISTENNEVITDPVPRVVIVKTLEGEMTAHIGDWIIRGVNGEYYPCKNDIFEKTYEKVEEQDDD